MKNVISWISIVFVTILLAVVVVIMISRFRKIVRYEQWCQMLQEVDSNSVVEPNFVVPGDPNVTECPTPDEHVEEKYSSYEDVIERDKRMLEEKNAILKLVGMGPDDADDADCGE